MSFFSLRPSKIATDSMDKNCVLVLLGDGLIAIVTKLEAAEHAEMRGRWFIEAAFGRCQAPPERPFEKLSDALRWIVKRIGEDSAKLESEFLSADNAFS